MAIKRRYARYTMAATTGSTTIGLGAAYGRVIGFEFKGDDAAVNASTTIGIVDQLGRSIVDAHARDAGTDDSTALRTSQSYSTVGVFENLSPVEGETYDQDGVAGTTAAAEVNVTPGSGIVAKSPLTVSFAAGTSGDAFEVAVWVEV